MKTSKFITVIAAAAFGLAASTVAALAVPATATAAVNVRTGGGTSYAIIDTLYAGEAVNVTQCQSGWCYIEHSGPNGWVSGNYLSAASGGGGSSSSAADDAAAAAAIQIFGTILGAVVNSALPPPPAPAQVCFFNGPNYTGASFCVNAGNNDNKLVGFWNDRISSITVSPGSSVTVCRNWFYGGICNSYNVNKPNLIWQLNNRISSYKTL